MMGACDSVPHKEREIWDFGGGGREAPERLNTTSDTERL